MLRPAVNDAIGGLEISMALQFRGVDEAEPFHNVADQRIPAIAHCQLPHTSITREHKISIVMWECLLLVFDEM